MGGGGPREAERERGCDIETERRRAQATGRVTAHVSSGSSDCWCTTLTMEADICPQAPQLATLRALACTATSQP